MANKRISDLPLENTPSLTDVLPIDGPTTRKVSLNNLFASITKVGTIATGDWSGTPIALNKGGTGATTAADARSALGLVIGTNVQAPISLTTTGSSGAATFVGTTLNIPQYSNAGLAPANNLSDLASPAVALRNLSVGAEPIILFATGQSQFVKRMTMSWSPSPNAVTWNYSGTAGNVGNAFVALTSTSVNSAEKWASDIAAKNPTRKVYLICIAQSGQPISKWLTGSPTPDVYADCVNNMTPALAAAGKSTIDVMWWWQGEPETSTTALMAAYPANWEAMIARFRALSWFPRSTPILLAGIATTADSGNANGNAMNSILSGVASVEPDLRRHFTPGYDFSGSTFWDAGDPGHMTAVGYFAAGNAAANITMGLHRGGLRRHSFDAVGGGQVLGKPAYDTATVTINANDYALPATIGSVEHLIGADAGNAFSTIDAYGGIPGITVRRANGTAALPTAVANADIMGSFAVQGYANGAFNGTRASFLAVATETHTSTAQGVGWSIYGTPNGTTAPTQTTLPVSAISNVTLRPALLAALTVYVRTDGSNSNNGLANTSGGAFLTVQKAIDFIASLDLSTYQATIQIADGTYTGTSTLRPYVGQLPPIIKGNTTTPANVLINTAGTAFLNTSGCVWQINDLKITTSSGDGLGSSFGGIYFQNIDFGTISQFQISSFTPGFVVATGNYAVSGGAQCHVAANGRIAVNGKVITFSNSPAFSVATVLSGRGGVCDIYSMTFTNGGTVTGTRYILNLNGTIYTNSAANATYIPGNAAGTNDGTGAYL